MLFCNNCKSHQNYYTKENGVHLTAYCQTCDTYLKNVPHQPPMFYVGKYKGQLIEQIDDLQYLKWAKENMTSLSAYLREAVSDRIYSLENMLR